MSGAAPGRRPGVDPVATVRKGTHDFTFARKPTSSAGPAAGRLPAGTSAPLLAVSTGEAVTVAASSPPSPPDAEEAAALVRVQGGETEPFDLLVRRYMRAAFTIAFRIDRK